MLDDGAKDRGLGDRGADENGKEEQTKKQLRKGILEQKLGSVKTGKEVEATRFQFWHKGFGDIDFYASFFGLTEETSEFGEVERRFVADDHGVFGIGEFFGFCVSVFDVTETVDEVGLFGIFSGDDPTVGQALAKFIFIEVAFAGNDSDELTIGVHDHFLDIILLLLSHLAGTAEHVFEGAAFEGDTFESDFSKEFAIV